MKIIFVTWWVISGLWKGITAASVWKLFATAGYSVGVIKMDPYLNVDAWTMSPFEHGEVFVTEDGSETDLDFGHYERFLDITVNGQWSITSGKIYNTVLDKERKGEYLWDTIQVIPHVVNEVKEAVLHIAKDKDITFVELGGTIGDIEWLHFTEAARQLKKDVGRENIFYIHVVPVLYLSYSGEFKTKPIQNSHKDLTRIWIQEDMIMCRSDFPLPKWIKEKISLFCDIDEEYIIENVNVSSIYELPQLFAEQNVHKLIQKSLHLPEKHPDLSLWQAQVEKLICATKTVNIWIVWKYAKIQDSYISVVEALIHGWAHHNAKINIERIHAEDFEDEAKRKDIQSRVDGLLIPWGFGMRWMEGKIQAAKLAREEGIPYLGLCLWLQMAVIDFARHVCWLEHANTLEAEPDTETPVISFMPWQSEELAKWWSMRLWAYTTKLKASSKIMQLYERYRPNEIKEWTISERHRHRYEVNPDYYELLEEDGLVLSWRDIKTNLVEFIELPDHPFFVWTQAHPEFKSRLDKPHPLFTGFVEACLEKSEK